MDFKNVLNMGNDNTCMKAKHPTSKTIYSVLSVRITESLDTMLIITIITCVHWWALSSWHWIIFKFAALTSKHKHMLNLFTRRVLSYLSLLRVSSLTNIQWPYYWGRVKVHDLRAVTTNTPYIAFPLLEQLFSLTNTPWCAPSMISKTRNVNSRTVIVKTTWNFPSAKITLQNRLLNRHKCILQILKSKKQYKIRPKHYNFLNFGRVAVLTVWNYKRFYCLGLQNVAVGCINEGFL